MTNRLLARNGEAAADEAAGTVEKAGLEGEQRVLRRRGQQKRLRHGADCLLRFSMSRPSRHLQG